MLQHCSITSSWECLPGCCWRGCSCTVWWSWCSMPPSGPSTYSSVVTGRHLPSSLYLASLGRRDTAQTSSKCYRMCVFAFPVRDHGDISAAVTYLRDVRKIPSCTCVFVHPHQLLAVPGTRPHLEFLRPRVPHHHHQRLLFHRHRLEARPEVHQPQPRLLQATQNQVSLRVCLFACAFFFFFFFLFLCFCSRSCKLGSDVTQTFSTAQANTALSLSWSNGGQLWELKSGWKECESFVGENGENVFIVPTLLSNGVLLRASHPPPPQLHICVLIFYSTQSLYLETKLYKYVQLQNTSKLK